MPCTNTSKSGARTHSSFHKKRRIPPRLGKPCFDTLNSTEGRLSSDNIQSITEAAASRFASVPHYAQPLPLPPEHDFLADVEADQRLAAVMCAVARIAKQRGNTFQRQIEIWETGE